MTPSHRSLPLKLRKDLQPLIRQMQHYQLPTYLVGGCVRDLMLGRPVQDIDVVLEGSHPALGKALARVYRAKLVTHPAFLTFTLVLPGGRHLDVATTRRELYPEPAALPTVEEASLQEDLFRRDFSINAMALSLNAGDFGHMWDPFGGGDDLKRRQIRVLHSDSFRDDPTRVFRAARFAGRFSYALEWKTRQWLLDCVAQQVPSRLSGARLREELVPLLMEEDPRPAFRLLSQWNALSFLIPSLKWEKSHELFFARILGKRKKESSLLLRLMVLLHALPFPKAVGCLGHLMFPQSSIQQIEQALLLLVHLRQGTLSLQDARSGKPRSLISDAKAFLDEAMRLSCLVSRRQSQSQWRRYQDTTPRLSGQDIRDLGYRPGPLFSRIFDALRQAHWEGKLRTREEEIRFVAHTFPLHAT